MITTSFTKIYLGHLILLSVAILSACEPNKSEAERQARHDAHFEKGISKIGPYALVGLDNPHRMREEGHEKKLIKEGIQHLDTVTSINPENAFAFWIKGKGYQVLEQFDHAYHAFEEAYRLEPEQADFARELMLVSLDLGKNKEALAIGKKALSMRPSDYGLQGNLALAYFLNAHVDSAEALISKALRYFPDDPANQYVKELIMEVKQGKRPQPDHLDDLRE
ncbi:MAG: tetratricopeptide repeat protein [Bacteroidota bacterium]